MSETPRVGHRPFDSRIGQHCDICGQVDDHPRHHISSPSGVESVHFDCHAANGCEVCAESLQKAPKDARHGANLIAHLIEKGGF